MESHKEDLRAQQWTEFKLNDDDVEHKEQEVMKDSEGKPRRRSMSISEQGSSTIGCIDWAHSEILFILFSLDSVQWGPDITPKYILTQIEVFFISWFKQIAAKQHKICSSVPVPMKCLASFKSILQLF
ncbi:hypothetical protein WA026_000160 [Henosepilachna vigintioctopunctata]|uniref:Uncharacterized protein n=1 Tax=Henosepilachna vigintioctopunctata TaxID=420089 RepID=A0AAW1V4X0_9CUCU